MGSEPRRHRPRLCGDLKAAIVAELVAQVGGSLVGHREHERLEVAVQHNGDDLGSESPPLDGVPDLFSVEHLEARGGVVDKIRMIARGVNIPDPQHIRGTWRPRGSIDQLDEPLWGNVLKAKAEGIVGVVAEPCTARPVTVGGNKDKSLLDRRSIPVVMADGLEHVAECDFSRAWLMNEVPDYAKRNREQNAAACIEWGGVEGRLRPILILQRRRIPPLVELVFVLLVLDWGLIRKVRLLGSAAAPVTAAPASASTPAAPATAAAGTVSTAAALSTALALFVPASTPTASATAAAASASASRTAAAAVI